MYKITIVVSTHNRSDFLKKSIVSYPKSDNIEILIMENGSTQKEVEVYKELVKKYSGVKLVNLKNGNLPASRNKGISMAKGEYIFLIDDDDIITEEFSRFMKKFEGQKNIYRFPYIRYNKIETPIHFGRIRKQSIFNTIEVSTWLIKKRFFIDKKIKFNENFWWSEDQYFAAKVFGTLERQNFKNILSIKYDFLNNDNSMVRMKQRIVSEDFKIFKYLDSSKYDLMIRIKLLKRAIREINAGVYDHDWDNAYKEILLANKLLKENNRGLNLNKLKKRF